MKRFQGLLLSCMGLVCSVAMATPHILGSDSAAQDITDYANTIFQRFEQAIQQGQGQSNSHPVPANEIEALLNQSTFPLNPTPLTFRQHHDVPIQSAKHHHPSGQSYCVVGSDNYSLQWLGKLVQTQPHIKQCFLIEVENADLLRQWLTSIRSIKLIPMQGQALAAHFNVRYYPVVLEYEGMQ